MQITVVGCKNQHQCLYSVPATEQQKRQWLHLIFNDNVPATVCVCLYMCANHFTSDCFSNEGQYKAVKSLDTCKLETETTRTMWKNLETVLETNRAFASC